ncbi:MAG TPA: LON peptidase substrate-binding domain-containing protein [Stellaceae bacterium]|nr:LON peptidase substrate-binding domain-containing protein [Stellaceae bacterium]
MRSPGFETPFSRLPASLPVFPLSGAMLLPRGRLPLNIFEPRYLAMIDDALAGDRLIGMIQPIDDSEATPVLHRVGCVGRLTSVAEEGRRYIITLNGVCRFAVGEELTSMRGYRRIVPEWSEFQSDYHHDVGVLDDRPRLIAGLKSYFKRHDLAADWTAIEKVDDERLVTSLAMVCPFQPVDKQALLEAPNLTARGKLLTGLVEMAVTPPPDGPTLN